MVSQPFRPEPAPVVGSNLIQRIHHIIERISFYFGRSALPAVKKMAEIVDVFLSIGLLTNDEAEQLVKELKAIYHTTLPTHHSPFTIHDNIEDVHSQVEFLLTEKLGDIGKKIHSARSRNDQVLVDVKLFLRN